MMAEKLTKYRTITGTVTCETGLRIGGSKEDIEIGGMENPIIRHPITDRPYIPGSSLKGKVRSLLEQKRGLVTPGGEPCGCGECMVCRVFGPHKNVRHQLGPTRILVRDADLSDVSVELLQKAKEDKGIFYAEVKTENIINRRTGTAEHPRTLERVPAGTVFDFEIAVRIFEGDDEGQIMGLIEEGLALLEQDYLGSSGSRGYGKVKLAYEVS